MIGCEHLLLCVVLVNILSFDIVVAIKYMSIHFSMCMPAKLVQGLSLLYLCAFVIFVQL